MRLFDKCIALGNGEMFDQIRDTEPPVVLAADWVAVNCIEDDGALRATPNTGTCCRPPWPYTFVEWNSPLHDVQQVGVFCVECGEPKEKARELLDGGDMFSVSEVDSVVVMKFVFAAHGQVADLPGRVFSVFGADGILKGAKVESPESAEILPAEKFWCRVAMLSFQLLHCKNVTLEDVTDDLQPPAKIRRRLKIPEVKRYTLNIAGHVVRPSRDYNSGPQGVMPFHLCRGHFAMYTPEKPMFGNPKLVGRYWHPPHMKGKKENGEIVKDYAIQT